MRACRITPAGADDADRQPRHPVRARPAAGLTVDDAVRKVGITDARGVAAADRLVLLEWREQEPVLIRMATVLQRQRELSLTGRLSGSAGWKCE